MDGMPPLLEPPKTPLHSGHCEPGRLWDAYAEFGRPSRAARSLRGDGAGGAPEGRGRGRQSESWFKFRVAR